MLGNFLLLLAKGAEAFAGWIRGRQQAKDQGDGQTIQRAADQTAVIVSAEAAQASVSDLDQRSTESLRAEAMEQVSGQ